MLASVQSQPLSRRRWLGATATATSLLLLSACGLASPSPIPATPTPPLPTRPPASTAAASSPTNPPAPIATAAAASQPPANLTPTSPVGAPTTAPAGATSTVSAPAGANATATGAAAVAGGGGALPASPACRLPAPATIAQTEGPYFKAGAPNRNSLVMAGMSGTPLLLSGLVLSTRCQPVGQARLDFWQADARGQYDNSGFGLRGYQLTDQAGRYRLETIMPGLYPGRTRHIHVKIQAPGRPALTTQIYFPGEAQNARDSIFDARLVVAMQEASGGQAAAFDFVLDLG